MKKIFLFIALTTLILGGVVTAQGIDRHPATVSPSGETVNVPNKATENSPVLEKITFIHYKKGFVKPGTECGNGICEPGENVNKCPADCGGEDPINDSSCYTFIGRGLNIKSPKLLSVHPDLDLQTIVDSASEWDLNVSTDLFSGSVVDPTANWEEEVSDGKNEFSFYDYTEEGVIGVANVWGYFTGPPWAREIVEFDIMFDTDYIWGDATVISNVMDLQNIATHEIGHAVGMGDLYEDACGEMTMYGYSGYGETKKRTLEQPDIRGLQELYGN